MATQPLRANVVQTNLQHSTAATANLSRVLEKNNETIALIQEPWIRAGRVCGLNKLSGKLLFDNTCVNIRACIFVPQKLKAMPLTQFCSRDLVAASLQDAEGEQTRGLVIASAYMHADEDVPPQPLVELVRHCEVNNLRLIISADGNAHHPIWGMQTANNRGEELVSFLLSTNLTIANIGAEPTYVTRRASTIIDITLVSNNCTLVKNWRVSDEHSASDHRWIRYELEITQTVDPPKRNPRNTDRKRYASLVCERVVSTGNMGKITNTVELEDTVTKLTNSLIDSFEKACPASTPRGGGKGKPGWSRSLEKLRKKARKLYNRARNTYSEEDWERYKMAQKEYKRSLRREQRQAWRKFSTSIESNHHANRIRKILSADSRKAIGTLKKTDNTYTKTEAETNLVLLQTHFPGCQISDGNDWDEETTCVASEADWKAADEVVSQEKVTWAIKSFQPFKAPGLDGVFPGLLQWVEPLLNGTLISIFKSCIAHRYIPRGWREVRVMFIPKPGKSDYTEAKSYRPISLTSFILKTLERLCDRYLRDDILNKIPLHPNQHAYSSGKSTESALHTVVQTIEHEVNNKALCLGAFIDIEGAFDRTSFDSVRSALRHHAVNMTITDWLSNMLKQRAVRIDLCGSTRAVVKGGCPQGGVTSPLIWNMTVNELITKLNRSRYLTIGYADDLTILIPGHFASVACNLMRNALRIVENWCREHNLTVNPAKTELVMFTNKRNLGPFTIPTFFGKDLTLSEEVKYLGITLDRKLNWSTHLDNKLRKAAIAFWQCNKMVGKTWGLNPKITLWLYNTVVRPALTYGAIVWWPKTNRKTTVTKLQKFQRTACKAATGCMKSAPTTALEALLGVTPLHLFIKQEAAVAAHRLRALNLWTYDQLATHTTITDEFKECDLEIHSIYDKVPKQYVFERNYKIQLHEECSDSSGPEELRIYTDGSKTEEGTGSGAFSEDLNIHITTALGGNNSIFQAECVGIIQAAAAVLKRKVTDYNIRILSDSAAVLKALQGYVHMSGLTLQCHELLEAVSSHNHLTLQWIKGHSGSRGNDSADELARRGSNRRPVGPGPIVPLPFSQVRTWIRKHTQSLHNNLWASTMDCRQSREVFPELNPRYSRRLLKLPRNKLRLVIGIVTGHCPLNKHLFNIGVTDSPLCRGCLNREETAAHLLLECDSVAVQRQDHLGSPRTLQEACTDISELLAFLEETGWLS